MSLHRQVHFINESLQPGKMEAQAKVQVRLCGGTARFMRDQTFVRELVKQHARNILLAATVSGCCAFLQAPKINSTQ